MFTVTAGPRKGAGFVMLAAHDACMRSSLVQFSLYFLTSSKVQPTFHVFHELKMAEVVAKVYAAVPAIVEHMIDKVLCWKSCARQGFEGSNAKVLQDTRVSDSAGHFLLLKTLPIPCRRMGLAKPYKKVSMCSPQK